MTDIKSAILDGILDSVLDKDKIGDVISDVILGKDDDQEQESSSRRSRSTSTSRRSSTMLELEVYGPVTLPVTGSGSSREVAKEDVERFWEYKEAEDVASKKGIFIVALKNRSKYTPWYLGKATKNLKTSTLASKAKGEINDILAKEKGSPVIFFIAPGGNKRSFPTSEQNDCYKFITQCCLAANKKLQGGASTPPMWSIDGVLRSSGRSSKAEEDFADLLGI